MTSSNPMFTRDEVNRIVCDVVAQLESTRTSPPRFVIELPAGDTREVRTGFVAQCPDGKWRISISVTEADQDPSKIRRENNGIRDLELAVAELSYDITSLEEKLTRANNKAELLDEEIESIHLCMDGVGAPITNSQGAVLPVWARISKVLDRYEQKLLDAKAAIMHEADCAESFNAENIMLKQQLDLREKEIVMLRSALKQVRQAQEATPVLTYQKMESIAEAALAASEDLAGCILCDAESVAAKDALLQKVRDELQLLWMRVCNASGDRHTKHPLVILIDRELK